MTPSLPVPTDNIYKFMCLFGLTLIVVAIFSYVSTYTASLDRKVKYIEVIIPLEAKGDLSKTEEKTLELNKRLLEVTTSNQNNAENTTFWVFVIGSLISLYGGWQWRYKIQTRDDKLAQLQMEKLALEVQKLRTEIAAAEPGKPTGTDGVEAS